MDGLQGMTPIQQQEFLQHLENQQVLGGKEGGREGEARLGREGGHGEGGREGGRRLGRESMERKGGKDGGRMGVGGREGLRLTLCLRFLVLASVFFFFFFRGRCREFCCSNGSNGGSWGHYFFKGFPVQGVDRRFCDIPDITYTLPTLHLGQNFLGRVVVVVALDVFHCRCRFGKHVGKRSGNQAWKRS